MYLSSLGVFSALQSTACVCSSCHKISSCTLKDHKDTRQFPDSAYHSSVTCGSCHKPNTKVPKEASAYRCSHCADLRRIALPQAGRSAIGAVAHAELLLELLESQLRTDKRLASRTLSIFVRTLATIPMGGINQAVAGWSKGEGGTRPSDADVPEGAERSPPPAVLALLTRVEASLLGMVARQHLGSRTRAQVSGRLTTIDCR